LFRVLKDSFEAGRAKMCGGKALTARDWIGKMILVPGQMKSAPFTLLLL